MKGKAFERSFAQKLKKLEIKYIRLRDASTVQGRLTKGTQNPADIIVINKKNVYLIELKCCKEARFGMARFKQLGAMLTWVDIAECWLVINFYAHKKKVAIPVNLILSADKSLKFDDKRFISYDNFLEILK